MRAGLMIICEIRTKDASEMLPVEHDGMVDTLSPDRTDQPFNERRLPRQTVCDHDFLDAHVLDAPPEEFAVDRIPITNQEARRYLERKCFD